MKATNAQIEAIGMTAEQIEAMHPDEQDYWHGYALGAAGIEIEPEAPSDGDHGRPAL